ncbi:hypothetical protein [Mycolicibacterium porcinum]|uniref:Uncharacterized protein n=2 Tax=Mycolicibacterium porcinum TaxID=39693 RepID=A0ABV3VIC6_9MYCO
MTDRASKHHRAAGPVMELQGLRFHESWNRHEISCCDFMAAQRPKSGFNLRIHGIAVQRFHDGQVPSREAAIHEIAARRTPIGDFMNCNSMSANIEQRHATSEESKVNT